MTEQQVLEFTLNDEQYCTGIKHVSEIVRRSEEDMTSVPNAPPHVEGVMDLRGETTRIIEPREVLSLETDKGDHDKVIVFESNGTDSESVGWTVHDVTRVSTIDSTNVEEIDDELIKGIINRNEKFLIWTSPEMIHTASITQETNTIA